MNAKAIRLLLGGGALAAAFVAGVALAPGFVSSAEAAVAGVASRGEALLGDHGATDLTDRFGPAGDLFKVAADYIGITPEQLRTEMGTDKSMADVAIAHGKTRDGLVQALEAAANTRIEQLVDQTFPTTPKIGLRVGFRLDAFKTVTDYLGLSAGDVMQQLRDGKTVGQIADATSGKSRQGLIDAIVAAETTAVDQAVTDGKLTQAQADTIKANLTDRVTRFVDATHPAWPPMGFGPGGRFGPGGWHR